MWLLEIVPQHDDEVVTVHAPLMLAQILKAIVRCLVLSKLTSRRTRSALTPCWMRHCGQLSLSSL